MTTLEGILLLLLCVLVVLCRLVNQWNSQDSRAEEEDEEEDAGPALPAVLPNAVARPPTARLGASTIRSSRPHRSSRHQAPPQELAPPLGTKLLELPDVLLGEVFQRVPGAASKHAFYRTCRAVRTSDAVNNRIRSLTIPSDKFFVDNFSMGVEQLLDSLSSWPKHATLRSLTMVEPSSRHFCREHRYRTGNVWGSDDELSNMDVQSNSSDEEGDSSQSSQSEQALSSSHAGETGGEGSDDSMSQEMDSEGNLSQFIQTDDGFTDEDDEEMSEDLAEDCFDTLLILFRECSKRGTRPQELMSTVEDLCLRNWELNSSKAFAVGCMIAACFPALKSLTVANFESLAVSGELQLHYSLLRAPQLSNLQSLSLVRSMLINNQCIGVIAQLTNLRHLKLQQVPFYDEWSDDMSESDMGSGVFSPLELAPLCSLTALQSLDVDLLFKRDNVEVSGLAGVVSACKNLRDLSLRALKLAPPPSSSSSSWEDSPMIPTAHLESLTLSHMHLSDLKHFDFSPARSNLKALHLGVLTLPVPSAAAHATITVLHSVVSQVSALSLDKPVQSIYLQKGLSRMDWQHADLDLNATTVSRIANALKPLGPVLHSLYLKDFFIWREDACTLALELPHLSTLHLHSCHTQSGALQVLVGKEMASLRWLRLGPCSAHCIAPGQIRAACSVALLTQRPTPLRITCMSMPNMHFERCKRWVLKQARRSNSRVELEVAEFSYGRHSWVRHVKAWGGNSNS